MNVAIEGREPSLEDEGNDNSIEEEEENEEMEDNVEDEEEVEMPSGQPSADDIPSLLLDLTANKKVNVKLPSPKDPVLPDLNKLREQVEYLGLLLSQPAPPAPPVDFAHVGGRHHKMSGEPQVPPPRPRVVKNNRPLPGLSNADAEELRHLREVMNNPFAKINMPTRPVKRKDESGNREQPPSDPDMGSPHDEYDNTGDSAYDFGESKPIYSISVHHRGRELLSPLYSYII